MISGELWLFYCVFWIKMVFWRCGTPCITLFLHLMSDHIFAHIQLRKFNVCKFEKTYLLTLGGGACGNPCFFHLVADKGRWPALWFPRSEANYVSGLADLPDSNFELMCDMLMLEAYFESSFYLRKLIVCNDWFYFVFGSPHSNDLAIIVFRLNETPQQESIEDLFR